MAIKQTEYIKFGENLYEIIPPLPSGTDRGGIIASPKQSTDTVEIKLGDDGKLYAPAYPDLSNIDTSEIQSKIDELTTEIENKADEEHTHVISDVANLQSTLDQKASLEHKHEISDITNLQSTLNAKALQTDLDEHTADTDVHMTTQEKTKLAGIEAGAQVNTITGIKGDSESSYRTGQVNITKANIGLGNVDNTSDANKPVSTAQQAAIDGAVATAKSYIDTKTTNMATTSVVDSKISTHNSSASAHNDIRVLISDLATEVSNFLDVDDTTRDQLSEVLTLIDNNKGTLDSLTTSKVNVADIVDNLTTASANKVLSANQGVVLKTLIDELEALVETKADASALTNYYTKAEIDGYEFITVSDIDSICGTGIALASEVMF